MEKEPNFHQIAEDRKSLRREVKETEGVKSKIIGSALEKANKEAKEFKLADFDNISEAKQRLQSDREKMKKAEIIDEEAVDMEFGGKYEKVASLLETQIELREYEMSLLVESRNNPQKASKNKYLIDSLRNEKSALNQELALKEKTDPNVIKAANLVEYKKGLHQEGHIAPTHSVKKYLHEIGTRLLVGKPMFLHGPTGTGKTSLARLASEYFTKKRAEMVYCNPQTRESNIWGKTGIKPTVGGGIETVDIYGPLAKAMQRGIPVIFDEFTALPKEQQVFIKGIMHAKPGDTVNVVGNGEMKIAPGFIMIFTANLKSEKNPERQELPPEIAREFEQNNLEVNYTPKEEAYDIMLTRLMERDGSINMSWYDLNHTLPKLCEAMTEIQMAYTDKESEETARLTQTMDAGGKRPGLKKLVLTQGTIENIIDAWKIDKSLNLEHSSFAEFLNKRLQTGLTFKEYPEADRILAAKILASKGFLRTLSEKDLALPEKTLDFDKTARENQEKIKEATDSSSKEIRISIKELSELDPWNKRGQAVVGRARDFLPSEESQNTESGESSPAQSLEQFFKETMKDYWNYDQTTLDKFKDMPTSINPVDTDWQKAERDTEPIRFGEYTLNPDTANIDWSTISPDKIKVFDLATVQGQKLSEVAKHIIANYPPSKYKMPGLEYWKYVVENPDKIPDTHPLKDGKYHFFFGSIFRDKDGRWHVPYSSWNGARFASNDFWLDYVWSSYYRLVLLEI